MQLLHPFTTPGEKSEESIQIQGLGKKCHLVLSNKYTFNQYMPLPYRFENQKQNFAKNIHWSHSSPPSTRFHADIYPKKKIKLPHSSAYPRDKLLGAVEGIQSIHEPINVVVSVECFEGG